MPELEYKRTPNGLVPANQETADYHAKLKVGEVVRCKVSKPWNLAFHRKYFTLLDFAFQHWNPGEITSKYGVPQKSKERFRKDIIILAGFYYTTIRLDGTVRVAARSISFAEMGQDEFEELYSNTINVILKKVLVNYKEKQLRQVVDKLLAGWG